MIPVIILFYIFLILLDVVLILDLNKLVYSFLLSKRNIKSAKKIHKSQSIQNKLTLAYIKDFTAYPRAFNFFQKIRMIEIFSIIPQYATIVIVNIFSRVPTIILLVSFSTIKIAFNVIARIQFNSNRISRFDKQH